jgi:hypothetical protein
LGFTASGLRGSVGASQLVSTAGSSARESASLADDGLREVGIVNLHREGLADGLVRLVDAVPRRT